MADNNAFDDNLDEIAAKPTRSWRSLAFTAMVSIGVFLVGVGLSAFWYGRQLAPLKGEVERLSVEKMTAEQGQQQALAQLELMRVTSEAERLRLEAQVKEKSDQADAARAAAEEAGRKAAESERHRLALVQDQAKKKPDDSARVAAAQTELKRVETSLKQKAAELERQKQALASLHDEKANQPVPNQKEPAISSLAGTWQGTIEGKGGASTGTLELIVYGSGFVGKCLSLSLCDGENYVLKESSIQGDKVVLVFKYIYEFRFELTVGADATTMEGVWSHSDILGTKHSGTVKFQKT